MGFRPEPTHYKLNFKGTDLEGLEVTMKSVTVREFGEMLKAATLEGITPETIQSNDMILKLFADSIVSWNLEDAKGKPVPRTVEGVKNQERPLIAKLLSAWQFAVAGVDSPLPSASGDGGTSQEAALALAESSRSQSS